MSPHDNFHTQAGGKGLPYIRQDIRQEVIFLAVVEQMICDVFGQGMISERKE